MKRYFSALLIPCLLLQLYGCYSLSEISLEELYNEEEAIITTKGSVNYHLKRNLTSKEILSNPDVYFSNDWLINPKLGNISIIYRKAYNKDDASNNLYIKNDTLYAKGFKVNIGFEDPFEGEIAIEDIAYFEVREADALATMGLVLGIGFLAVLTFGLIATIAISDDIHSCSTQKHY